MADAIAVRSPSDNSAGNDPLKGGLKEGLAPRTDDVPMQYKTMHWGHCSLRKCFGRPGVLTCPVMLAETISLGILSLPWAMDQVGGMASYVLVSARHD
jgi:hypothetical protein